MNFLVARACRGEEIERKRETAKREGGRKERERERLKREDFLACPDVGQKARGRG